MDEDWTYNIVVVTISFQRSLISCHSNVTLVVIATFVKKALVSCPSKVDCYGNLTLVVTVAFAVIKRFGWLVVLVTSVAMVTLFKCQCV